MRGAVVARRAPTRRPHGAVPRSARSTDTIVAGYRRQIEAFLAAWLAPAPDRPAELTRAMRYAVLGGGKRLRPILTLAGARAAGGAAAERLALPVACAIELVHAYSLVHDDLPAMDDDALRRGRPTVHVRFGEALAILAGDALLTEAFAVLASPGANREPGGRAGLPAARRIAIIHDVAAASGGAGMVGGQVVDLASERRPRVGLAAVASIHRRKTGALIRAAVRSGGVVAGASARELAQLTSFGEELGLAFQITDDVLDDTAGPARTGKRRGGDRERGKATYATLLGVGAARARAREAADRAMAAVAPWGARAEVLVALARDVAARAS